MTDGHYELIEQRRQLRLQMQGILGDDVRYQSIEFADCGQAITEVNARLLALGVNVVELLAEFSQQEHQLLEVKHPTAPSPKDLRRVVPIPLGAVEQSTDQLPAILSSPFAA
jgi:hypothetical protein